jgi:hypothetical protein
MQTFEDVGLPPGHVYPQLRLHVPTKCLIVLTSPQTGLPCDRLSIRKVEDDRYVEAVKLADNITVMDFALSQTLPVFYFITGTMVGASGDWDALYRYDLQSRTHELVAKDGELRADGDFSRLWLMRVLAVNDDERVVYVVAGMERTPGDLGYHVCALNRAERFLTPLTELRATFA